MKLVSLRKKILGVCLACISDCNSFCGVESMYAFAYEPEPTVTQDCLGPRTNSGVPRGQDLAGRPQKCCCSYGQWHSLSAAGMGRLV